VNAVMNLRVPKNAGKLPNGCTIYGLSSGAELHRVSYFVINGIRLRVITAQLGLLWKA
jgi:hypothetical protein